VLIRPGSTESALNVYRRQFKSSRWLDRPYVMVSVTVICAETDERAEELARPYEVLIAQALTGQKSPPFTTVPRLGDPGSAGPSIALDDGADHRRGVGGQAAQRVGRGEHPVTLGTQLPDDAAEPGGVGECAVHEHDCGLD
jgi:alkanesulfonate monooxygenase SsuD/methylene tetrahydromethanopterin reductase-like flavin-dependent oxidoreductase (luciferase family)